MFLGKKKKKVKAKQKVPAVAVLSRLPTQESRNNEWDAAFFSQKDKRGSLVFKGIAGYSSFTAEVKDIICENKHKSS